MINQSKDSVNLFKSVPYTCYELGHGWEYSCAVVFYESFKTAFIKSLQFYIPFYLVNYVIKYKLLFFRNKKWKSLITDILQSSLFLSLNGCLAMGGFCLLRHLIGKFYGWHAFMVGVAVGYLCFRIEKIGRRKSISVYTFLIASETLYRMIVFRKLVNEIKYVEVFLFICTSAAFMSLFGSCDHLPKNVQELLQKINGQKTEMRYSKKIKQLLEKLIFIRSPNINFVNSLLTLKHNTCPHNGSCVCNLFEGFLASSVLGSGLDACANIMRFIQAKQKFNFYSISFYFLKLFVSYTTILRLCRCLLRWIQNKDSPTIHGAISGAIAGGSFIFYRSSTLSLYCFAQLLQVFINQVSCMLCLPSDTIHHHMYALSIGILLHAAFLEPHNIKTNFWNFIVSISGGKFRLMFRKLLDVFGTNASWLYPNYVPKLKKNHVVTSVVKDILIAHGKW